VFYYGWHSAVCSSFINGVRSQADGIDCSALPQRGPLREQKSRRHDLNSVTVVSKVSRSGHPPSGSMLKSGVSSDIATFYWLHDWSSQSESFSALAVAPRSNRVAKQSDGSRLLAAVKVIHNLARAVPEKSYPTEMLRVVLTYPKTIVLSGF